jgi:hypothetical protein
MHSTLSFTTQDSTVQDYIFHMTWKVLGVCVNSYAKMCQLVEKEMLCINILVNPHAFPCMAVMNLTCLGNVHGATYMQVGG